MIFYKNWCSIGLCRPTLLTRTIRRVEGIIYFQTWSLHSTLLTLRAISRLPEATISTTSVASTVGQPFLNPNCISDRALSFSVASSTVFVDMGRDHRVESRYYCIAGVNNGLGKLIRKLFCWLLIHTGEIYIQIKPIFVKTILPFKTSKFGIRRLSVFSDFEHYRLMIAVCRFFASSSPHLEKYISWRQCCQWLYGIYISCYIVQLLNQSEDVSE